MSKIIEFDKVMDIVNTPIDISNKKIKKLLLQIETLEKELGEIKLDYKVDPKTPEHYKNEIKAYAKHCTIDGFFRELDHQNTIIFVVSQIKREIEKLGGNNE